MNPIRPGLANILRRAGEVLQEAELRLTAGRLPRWKGVLIPGVDELESAFLKRTEDDRSAHSVYSSTYERGELKGALFAPMFVIRWWPSPEAPAPAPRPLAEPAPAPRLLLPSPPAPAPRGLRAISAPRQSAADSDRHDDDFADDVVVGPNPGLRPALSPSAAQPRTGLRAFDLWRRAGGIAATPIDPAIFNGGKPNCYQTTDRPGAMSDLVQAQLQREEIFHGLCES